MSRSWRPGKVPLATLSAPEDDAARAASLKMAHSRRTMHLPLHDDSRPPHTTYSAGAGTPLGLGPLAGNQRADVAIVGGGIEHRRMRGSGAEDDAGHGSRSSLAGWPSPLASPRSCHSRQMRRRRQASSGCRFRRSVSGAPARVPADVSSLAGRTPSADCQARKDDCPGILTRA